MNSDTPLTEVAKLLPSEAAAHLLEYPEQAREAVLLQVREIIAFWETRDVQLDPITFSVIVTSMIPSLSTASMIILGKQEEVHRLQSLLMTADALIRKGRE